MKLKSTLAGACALLIATAVHAGEKEKTRIEIAIDDDDAGERSFVFDSREAGFDLQSMLVGESRSITDRDGTTADLRRNEDGFEIEVHGRTIELPDSDGHGVMHGEHEVELRLDDSAVAGDSRTVRVVESDGADGISIISGAAIDAATRERIAEVLRASGRNGKVHYIDDSEFRDGEHQVSGEREVRIIRKEVDATN